MKCCCYAWIGAPYCYLDMLDKLQKWVSRTVGPSASLESLAHCQNVANLSLYSFVYVHLNWLNWFHFLHLAPGPLVILIHDFSETIPCCYKDVCVISFSSLWNYLPPECFPLI